MPGSSTTPGRLGARVHAPIRVAFRIRNGVGTRDNNLCEAQWLACAFPYRRFAAVLTDDRARLGADVVSYSFTVSDLHRLLVAGLPAHCERFCTSSQRLADAARQQTSALGSFASMIGAAGQSSLIEKGSQMLASLLGGRDQAALASAVAKYAGLGQGAGGSLLGMLAPVDDDALAVGGPHVDAEGEMRPRAAFASTKPQVAAAQRVVAPAA